jgi:hypothetical protein
MGQFQNFLRFFFKQQSPSETAVVTSKMMSSNQVYFEINATVARNLRAKFGVDWTLSEFPTIFSSKNRRPCGRRDVIVGDVTSSLPAEQFQGGEETPCQDWRGWESFRIVYDFFKQNPPSCAAAMTSSSVTSHRAYPQNDSEVARNLQAKFGADRTVSEFSAIF